MLSYQAPKVGDVKSLINWVENSSSLATDETAYLSKPDLLCAASASDDPLVQVELLLEKVVIFCYRLLKKVRRLHTQLLLYPSVTSSSSPPYLTVRINLSTSASSIRSLPRPQRIDFLKHASEEDHSWPHSLGCRLCPSSSCNCH